MAVTGARVCIMCGEQRGPSNEHVLPQWIWRELYGADDRTSPVDSAAPAFHSENIASFAGATSVHRVPIGDRPSIKAHRITVNRVCEACNSGWMSNLEGRVKLILRRLWGNRYWRLNPDPPMNLVG